MLWRIRVFNGSHKLPNKLASFPLAKDMKWEDRGTGYYSQADFHYTAHFGLDVVGILLPQPPKW